MSARAQGWLSPAVVISLIALLVSLTGGAIAALIITSNSQVAAHTIAGAKAATGVNQNIMPATIGGSDIAVHTIAGAKALTGVNQNIVPGTIGGTDIANGAIGPANMAAPKWLTLPLLNGWQGAPFGTGTPAVALDAQGFVHFRGAMRENSSTFNATAFVLPTTFWPSHTVFVPVDMVNATTGRLRSIPTAPCWWRTRPVGTMRRTSPASMA
jgi:hypothetical protein